jgi:regulator of replication initiation timing
MSNSVGTHVGYCVYYNKPHYIYIQDLKQVSSNIDYQLEVDIEKEKQRIDEKTEIANAFSNISEKVNEEQYHICNKYWGFSKVKSKKEMSDIFYFCEKIYQFDKNSVKSIKKHN